MASKIETKLLNGYREFTNKNGEELPIAVNVLVRHYNGVIGEDCVFITKDGKSCDYGTQVVAGISEVTALCSPIDFLPEDFNSFAAYENEVDKYAEDKGDEEYYFPNHRFAFTILDVKGFVKLPSEEEENMVGAKQLVEGGVKYTPDRTDNGYAFKDLKAIAKRSGICYIAESGFDNGELVLTPDNTWEHINNGAVETYESAMRLVKNDVSRMFHGFATDCNFALYMEFIHWITDSIFQEVDYQCFDSRLNEYDLEENLTYFLESKFVDFAKKRLKQDGDDTEYADDDDLWDKLSNYLGRYCYRHDDFSLTDWDSLIDKWEDEPNY